MNLLNTVVELCKTAFVACVGWFEQIMEKTGMLPFYLGGLFVFFSVGFLLSPLRNGLPGGMSDVAAESAVKGKGKYASGKWTRGNKSYRGHFQKGKFEK